MADVTRTSCSARTRDPGSQSFARRTRRAVLIACSHSFRFEHKLGPRLKVTALIDPSVERAEKVLEGKRQSFVESAYRNTRVYKTIEDYHAALKQQKRPDPQ